MPGFPTHTLESAPAAAKPILEGAQKALGFVPNLYATMAEAPALLEGYTTLGGIFDKSDLSATERQIILLTTSFENGCDYCVAAHTTIAGMQKVDADVVTALRGGTALTDPKLAALRTFTRRVVQAKGWAGDADLQALLAAGYTHQTALEVVLGVGMKTISNYANHIASTPLDAAFAPAAWEKPEPATA